MSYTEPIGDVWKYSSEYNAAADFLGIDRYKRENINVAKKISYIVDWANLKNKNTKLEDSLWVLNDLKKKMGINTSGELLVGQLFEFVRLKQDRERKTPEVPYKEVMNQMIEERRASKIKSEEFSFKAVQSHIKQKNKAEQEDTKKSIQSTISKFQRSFKPEPELKVKTQKPVDSTPQPI